MRFHWPLIWGMVAAGAIAACQAVSDSPTENASQSLSVAADCRAIVHDMGETEVCGQPTRIVVLGPYVLEPLLALGIQPIAFADHVAFHQGHYNNPSQQIPYLGSQITTQPANVGLAFEPNIEAVLAVQPDLILAHQYIGDQYETLAKIAPTLVLDYADPEQSLKILAEAVNRTDQVEPLLMATQQQIATARETFAPLVATHPKVLLLASSKLEEIRLESRVSPCNTLLQSLGFEIVTLPRLSDRESDASVPISLETLPQFNEADLIILLGHDFTELAGTDDFDDHQLLQLKQAWEENAIAQSLDASQADRVYFIPVYLCRGLPGTIGTELYLEELKEQLLSSDGGTE